MARQLVWSLSSQSPLDEAVVAPCAQQKAASATPLERGIELDDPCWTRAFEDSPGAL